MHKLIKEIQSKFETNANPEYAEQMSAYMRNKFKFYGIRSPKRYELIKPYISSKALKEVENPQLLIRELWEMEYRDFLYVASAILNKLSTKMPEDYISDFEYLITTNSWWDSIDVIVPNALGKFYKKYPHLIKPTTNKWIESGNIWLQRSCILYQLKYKKDTDLEQLYSIIERLNDSDEFFVQKAIGWILREYSKTDAKEVVSYVENNKLPALSKREALKYLKKKGLL